MNPNFPTENITPFYFGTPATLFGNYHAPQPAIARDSAVLVCAPMGQDYIRAHRAIRQLAVRLAAAGFPVLRFDYSASGDSAGDDDEVSVKQWLADVTTASAELQKRSNLQRISLVGMRLGVALAAIIGAEQGTIEKLVAWEPVIDGEAYVAELIERHQKRLQYFLTDPTDQIGDSKGQTELLGFAVTETFLDELKDIDLLAIRQKPAQNILIVEREPQDKVAQFKAHLVSLGTTVTYQQIDGPRIWTEDPDRALVPHQVLRAIVTWMEI